MAMAISHNGSIKCGIFATRNKEERTRIVEEIATKMETNLQLKVDLKKINPDETIKKPIAY